MVENELTAVVVNANGNYISFHRRNRWKVYRVSWYSLRRVYRALAARRWFGQAMWYSEGAGHVWFHPEPDFIALRMYEQRKEAAHA